MSIYLCETPYLLQYAGDTILEDGPTWVAEALEEPERCDSAVVANPPWDGRFAEAA